MGEFTDSQGNVWRIHISLGASRRLATICNIDIFNPNDYHRLLMSLGSRIEYAFHCCKDRAEQLGVKTLDEFDELLTGESVTQCSDALQEALVFFYRKRGQETMAILAEENLESMKKAREAIDNQQLQETLRTQTEKLAKAGQPSQS